MVIPSPAGHQLLSQFLTVNGDGTGTANMIGDYSGAIEEVFISPPEGETIVLISGSLHLKAPGRFDPGGYGPNGRLINGVHPFIEYDGNLITSLSGGSRMFANSEGVQVGQDEFVWQGLNPAMDISALTIRFNFRDSFGAPLYLTNPLQRFVFSFNDDFTSFIHHGVIVQGFFLHRSAYGELVA